MMVHINKDAKQYLKKKSGSDQIGTRFFYCIFTTTKEQLRFGRGTSSEKRKNTNQIKNIDQQNV